LPIAANFLFFLGDHQEQPAERLLRDVVVQVRVVLIPL
jgi:hypothetical protein